MPFKFTDLVNSTWWGFYKLFLQEIKAPEIALLYAVQGYKKGKPTWDSAKAILTNYGGLLDAFLPQDMMMNIEDATGRKHQQTEEAPSPTLFDGAYDYWLWTVVRETYEGLLRGRLAFVKWLQQQGLIDQ